MKKCFLLCVLPMMLCGDIVSKPDANTLWLENGNPLKLSPKGIRGWRARGGEIKQIENGFEFNAIGKKGDVGMYLAASKEFPYLEFDLEIVETGHHFSMYGGCVTDNNQTMNGCVRVSGSGVFARWFK